MKGFYKEHIYEMPEFYQGEKIINRLLTEDYDSEHVLLITLSNNGNINIFNAREMCGKD